ncbi:Uncharacterised protein [Burkholderia oklahomensis]|nr:hypothetical protein BG90_860 [Burkholderia oklahomensis C6786]MBI0360339.1 hypothetical protein [Burkholderia oklahomensis]SUW59718.1 Uncharacterised protein [Burkholderia oklahomensis]
MKHPYLTTRADSTSYYFRRKVPLKLRAFFEKTEIWLSLETPRLNEAITRLPMPPSNSNASSPRRGTRPTRSESTGCRMVCVPRATTNSPLPPDRLPRWLLPAGRCPGAGLLEQYRAHALAREREYRVALLAKDIPTAEGEPDEEVLADARQRLADEGYDTAAHLALLRQEMEQLKHAHAGEDYTDLREQVEELPTFEHTWRPAASDSFRRLLAEFATPRTHSSVASSTDSLVFHGARR